MQELTNQTFLSRATPSTYNGNGRVVNIYGNTIKYNQLSDVKPTHTINGVTITNNGDGSVTLNGTSNSSGILDTHQYVIAINDHKYAIIINTEPQNTYGNIVYSNITGTNGAYGSNVILNGSSGSRTVSLRTDNNVTYTNFKVYLMCIDLTALGMEDYTIAQVEQWLSDNFDTDYIPYTTGSLLSFEGTGLKTIGKNLFNPSNYAQYLQSDGTYRLTGAQSDITRNYIPEELVGKQLTFSAYLDLSKEASPTNVSAYANVNGSNQYGTYVLSGNKGVAEITFTPTSTSDYFWLSYGSGGVNYFTMSNLQLELGSTATEYTPYTESTLSLPTLTYFPTGMNRVNQVYDELTQSKAIKRLIRLDLGSLNWQYDSESGYERFYSSVISEIKPYPNTEIPNAVCSVYTADTNINTYHHVLDKSFSINTGSRIYVYDSSYTDAQAFKQAMSGVYLVCELATPVETDITWDSIFPIEVGGTEEIEGDTAPIICDLNYSSGIKDVIVHNVPEEGGSVSGTGTYLIGETCTLVATPNQHYVVVNFELDDEVVTTEDTYTFEVE